MGSINMPAATGAFAFASAVAVIHVSEQISELSMRPPFAARRPGRRIAGGKRAQAGLVDALVIREDRTADCRRGRPAARRFHT
jgi:hypothetical protein